MPTIDRQGALHAGDGKYTNKPQSAADFDLSGPASTQAEAQGGSEVCNARRLLDAMVRSRIALEEANDSGALSQRGRSIAFSEYTALLAKPDLLEGSECEVRKAADDMRFSVLRDCDETGAISPMTEVQRDKAATYLVKQLAEASSLVRQSREMGADDEDIEYHKGLVDGYGAGLVELVHADSTDDMREGTNFALMDAIEKGASKKDILKTVRERRGRVVVKNLMDGYDESMSCAEIHEHIDEANTALAWLRRAKRQGAPVERSVSRAKGLVSVMEHKVGIRTHKPRAAAKR